MKSLLFTLVLCINPIAGAGLIIADQINEASKKKAKDSKKYFIILNKERTAQSYDKSYPTLDIAIAVGETFEAAHLLVEDETTRVVYDSDKIAEYMCAQRKAA